MATPVYLFTGFLDSGKTTLIKDTLSDEQFMEGIDRTLVICLEQGENTYTEEFLDAHNTFIEFADSLMELTPEKLTELDTVYHPNQVFIEMNGTEKIPEEFFENMPSFLPIVQILTTVDASTFSLYVNAMRGMMYENLRFSDTVIVNRCTEDTDGRMLRGNIKAINNKAQIFYEGNFGEQVILKSGTLPFDINADLIDIKDDDYGLWYMDAAENPQKYDGKKITIRGKFAERLKGYKHTFIMGRQAMVCCANDTSLCGVTVTGVDVSQLKKNEWLEITGTLKCVPVDNGMETVVLYAESSRRYKGPADEYVYFS